MHFHRICWFRQSSWFSATLVSMHWCAGETCISNYIISQCNGSAPNKWHHVFSIIIGLHRSVASGSTNHSAWNIAAVGSSMSKVNIRHVPSQTFFVYWWEYCWFTRNSVTYKKSQDWPQIRNNTAVNCIGGKAIENCTVTTKTGEAWHLWMVYSEFLSKVKFKNYQ